MKNIVLSLVVALAAVTNSFAQYYNGEPIGTVYGYEKTSTAASTTKTQYTLLAVDENSITFRELNHISGRSEAVILPNKLTIRDNKAYLDPQNIIEAAKAGAVAALGTTDVDVKLSSNNVGFIPLTGKVGDTFPLNNYEITTTAKGLVMKLNMQGTKFEVVRKEEITTPAGTFKTFVVEMEAKMTGTVLGQSMVFDFKATYWIEPHKGVVKTVETSPEETATSILVSIK